MTTSTVRTSGIDPATLGLADVHDLHRVTVDDRTELAVNLATGNLVLRRTEFRLRTTGGTLVVRAVFNSGSDRTGRLGPGWVASPGPDTGLEIGTDDVRLRTEDGRVLSFGPPPAEAAGTVAHGLRLDRAGAEWTVTDPVSGRSVVHDAEGRPLRQQDRHGRATLLSRHAAVTDPRGRTLRYIRSGSQTLLTGPQEQIVSRWEHDPQGRPVRVTDATGASTALVWDGPALVAIEDAAGNRLDLRYDDEGRVSALERGAARTVFRYGDRRSVVVEADGLATTHEYDAAARPVRIFSAAHELRLAWSDDGRLRSRTEGTDGPRTNRHDDLGRLVEARLATGARVRVGYDDGARPFAPTSVTGADGHVVRRTWDEHGEPLEIRADGVEPPLDRRHHDETGRLESATDALGRTTRFRYDDTGHVLEVRPPEPLGPVRYSYDARSRVVEVKEGENRPVGVEYDDADRVVAVRSEDRVLVRHAHDPLGNVVRTEGEGWRITRTWTAGPRGPLLTGSVRTQDGVATEEVRYTYDPAGRLTTLSDPGGTTGYTWTGGVPTEVRGPDGASTRLRTDPAGRVEEIRFASGARQRITRDVAGRVTGLTVTSPTGEVLLRERSGYDEAGADTDALRWRARSTGGGPEELTRFRYDQLQRLVAAGETTYDHDLANNLLRHGAVELTINPAGQVSRFGRTVLVYDGAGNFVDETDPTGVFGYSPTNQTVLGVFGGVRVVDATYDGVAQARLRRLTETGLDGVETTHVLGRTALGITYVHEDGVLLSVSRAPDGRPLTLRPGDGHRYDVVVDAQGSVLALLDESGALAAIYDYTPFGAVTAKGPAAALNPFRYRGAYQLRRTAHALDHHLYNAFWGRFTQPEPTRTARHPYTYADNDPLNLHAGPRTRIWAALTAPAEATLADHLGEWRLTPDPTPASPPIPNGLPAPGDGVLITRLPRLVDGDPAA